MSGRAYDAFSELIPPYPHFGAEAAPEGTSWPVPAPRTVDNCNDDGSPGTLRAEIEAAASGDTIDLSQLACSTITLGLPITISQNSLTLSGAGSDTLTISGGNQWPLFRHVGIGTLAISGLTVAHGYLLNSGPAKGGCIYSAANVILTASVVSNCLVASSTSDAEGAGIYSASELTLVSSTLTGNHAIALAGGPGIHAFGGGAWARSFHSKYSTISNNSAHDYSPSPGGIGGGIYVYVYGGAQIESSTISGNIADEHAAIYAGKSSLNVTNSTISGNSSNYGGAILGSQQAMTLTSSTVAFNKSSVGASGITIRGADLILQSSIVADNIGSSDIQGSLASVLGSNNLVGSSDLQLPADTIHDCPKLDPLRDNGGGVRTHAIRLGSLAIDHGNNDADLLHDQRGAARVTGASADIGAFERQASDVDERIFFDSFDGGLASPCGQ
jgi:hypothetical protein